MPWRHWSVIVVLILANYIVFSIIGTLLFPANPAPAPTHIAYPTFTPGAPPLQRVGTPVLDLPTATATIIATSTLTATTRSTVIPTSTLTPTP
jgi:hypothetical protein